MVDAPHIRARSIGVAHVAAALLAALALVLQGAMPFKAWNAAMAMTALGHAGHVDCPQNAAGASHAASMAGMAGAESGVHAHDHQAKPDGQDHASHASPGTSKPPLPSLQLDCCTAVSAVVLSSAEIAVLPRPVVRNSVPPRPSDILEGMTLEGPSEPPRTSYQS